MVKIKKEITTQFECKSNMNIGKKTNTNYILYVEYENPGGQVEAHEPNNPELNTSRGSEINPADNRFYR